MSIIKESLMSKINEQEFSGTLDNTSEFKNAITHIKTVLKNKIGKKYRRMKRWGNAQSVFV